MRKAVILLCTVALILSFSGCTQKETTEIEHGELWYNCNFTATDYVELADVDSIEADVSYNGYICDYADGLLSDIQYLPLDNGRTEVEKGDIVEITYKGTIDGKEFLTSDSYQLIIGDYTFYIDGFADNFIGRNVGDTFSFKINTGSNYFNEDYREMEAEFEVEIRAILMKAEVTHENVTDAYAQLYFGYDSVADYYEYLEATLKDEYEENKEAYIEYKTVDAYTDACEIYEIPEELTDELIAQMKMYYTYLAEQNDGTFDDFLNSYYDGDESAFQEDMINQYEDSLNRELVLVGIIQTTQLEYSQDDYENYLVNIAANYGFDSTQTLIDSYGEEFCINKYCLTVAEQYLYDEIA